MATLSILDTLMISIQYATALGSVPILMFTGVLLLVKLVTYLTILIKRVLILITPGIIVRVFVPIIAQTVSHHAAQFHLNFIAKSMGPVINIH